MMRLYHKSDAASFYLTHRSPAFPLPWTMDYEP